MNARRLLAVSAVLISSLALTACLPSFPAQPRATPSGVATEEPAEPDAADGGYAGGTGTGLDAPEGELVVLDEDQVTPIPVYTPSTPAGTWDVGPGLPPGFPAGVPVISGRWIDDEYGTYETDGRPGYYATFWGGYDHMDRLVERLGELGFEADDRRDDTKRVIVATNERYKVIMNGAEVVTDPVDESVYDPSYQIIVVFEQ